MSNENILVKDVLPEELLPIIPIHWLIFASILIFFS